MSRILLVDSGAATTLRNVNEANPMTRFLNDLRKIAVDTSINKIVLCCDNGSSKFRMTRFPDYKKKRRELRAAKPEAEKRKDEKFFAEMNKFKKLASHWGIEAITPYGYEADDIAAFLMQHIDLGLSSIF